MKNAYRDFPIAIFVSVCSGSKGLTTLLESFEKPQLAHEPDDCYSDNALARAR